MIKQYLSFYFMREAGRDQGVKSDGSADWVCLNCSNLNYSFRKVCNRCRSITRQQNHHNFIQMQYLQAYYHNTYPQQAEQPLSEHNSKTPSTIAQIEIRNEDDLSSFRKAALGTEPQNSVEIKNYEYISQSGLMFLLQNAWEGFYAPSEVSQFKSEEAQRTREEEQGQYDNDDILSNFDLTFI